MNLMYLYLAGVLTCALGQPASSPGNTILALKEAKYAIANPASYQRDKMLQDSLNQNWVQMILPAPSSVNLLCKLGLLASSATDFALRPPRTGAYKLLTHPDSFKASLHQVSHWGWLAFNEAHASMDEIAQRTDQIPGTLSSAVEVLVSGDVNDIQDFVPMLIGEVSEHIQECTASAQRTRGKFEEMSEIVAEMLQGSLSTQQWNELEKSRLEIENRIASQKKMSLEEQVAKVAREVNETKSDVMKWRGEFENAFNNMPSGWDLLGLQLVETLTNFVEDALSFASMKYLGINTADTQDNQPDKSAQVKEPSKFEICVIGHQGDVKSKYKATNREFSSQERVGLTLLNGQFGEVFNKFKEDLVHVQKKEDVSIDTTITQNLNTFLDHLSRPFSSPNVKDDIKEPVMQLIGRVRATAQEISELQKAGKTANEAAKYTKIMDNYIAAATCLETMAREILQLPAVEPATPFDDDKTATRGPGGTLVEKHMYQAEKALATSEARLTRLEEMYEKKLEKQAQLTNTLQKVMNEIEKLTQDARTNVAVLEVLTKALLLLGDLEKQWKDLTLFFTAVEVRIRVSMAEKVKSLVNQMKEGVERNGVTTIIQGKLLFTALMNAGGEVALVNRVARKYMGISGKHIMPSINKAGIMITTTDENKRGKLYAELESDLRNANTDLQTLIRNEKNNFVKAIENRKKEIRDTYEPLLINVPKKVKAELQASVKSGITAVGQIETSKPSALENAAANAMLTGKPKNWTLGKTGPSMGF